MHELLKYFKPQSLFSIAFIPYAVYYIHMDIGCEFANALTVASAVTVVFQSIPACNRLDTCDNLHVTNLPYVARSCRACQFFFKALLYASYLFIVTLHYMVTWYIDILICKIMNLLLQKFTSIENQTFLQLQKFGTIWYSYLQIRSVD